MHALNEGPAAGTAAGAGRERTAALAGAGREPTAALAGAVAVLVAANVLNNRVAPRLAPLTSAAATGALLALARRSGLSWTELGFTEGRRGLRIGGALAAAVAAAYGAGIAIPATRRFFRDERALSLSRARALEEALLQVPIGTVLLEEVGFRGVLHGLLARSHGTPAAVAVSSALFGLWHVLPAIDMAAANPALSALASGEAPGGAVPAPSAGAARPPDAPDVPAGPPAAGPSMGPPTGPPAADTVRVVVGSVVSTGVVGAVFCGLRRKGGLAAPALLHVATNSLGYLFARIAPKERPAR
ncbi:CPBP family intramembrane glutamic endopeptidase [Planomonospora sp. ID82291]|uniref:CPBP family intramembrane glutamic endopeptidase n=1 Tax=Planomonospora sp. ID82291 TaxID=2738136 RepID=UPI0018C3E6CC|nr:CPBP family intramembrane glutamic endopeptidase [Planomonospora sp. ID82291]MBG0813512.1 CPBP family intramembrane metalloprotease [Planomonospora sp. ID82291]